MHETTFVNQIFTVLKQNQNQMADAKTVMAHVRLSPFSHVSPETLNETFKELSQGENIKGVTLNILPLELPLECRSCKTKSKIAKREFACPSCGSMDVHIHMEQEFFVESLEIERT